MNLRLFLCVLLTLAMSFIARPQAAEKSGAEHSRALANAVVLIIRHAEKPDGGPGLSPAGEQHAAAYTNYFRNYVVDSKPVKLDYLFCAADSANSHRSRLTLEPLGASFGLKIDARFKATQCKELAHEIQARPHGKHILICWHHGSIPQLVQALGGDAGQLL